MQSLLKELYHGNLRITERRPTEAYRERFNRFVKTSEAFEASLTQQQKQTFQQLMDELSDAQCCYEEEMFLTGFCLGSRFLLEVVQYEGLER